MEHTLSKEEILVQYLNRIAYGRQAFGIEAAARFYFDKPARDLSPAEAAYLAALPRSPGRFLPERDSALLRRPPGRDPPPDGPARFPFAPTPFPGRWPSPFASRPSPGISRRPISWNMSSPGFPRPSGAAFRKSGRRSTFPSSSRSKPCFPAISARLEKKGLTNGAVVVLDNETGAVRAMVGSRDFFDEAHDGQVNGALALRQPGSTLKPLTYALALEKGMTAATLIDDSPSEFGSWTGRSPRRTTTSAFTARSGCGAPWPVPTTSRPSPSWTSSAPTCSSGSSRTWVSAASRKTPPFTESA